MPNTRISDLTAATSVAGTDVYPSVQTAGVGPVKTSLTQITAFALANAPAGAVATPSIAPTGDTNTGFWFPAADTIAASTGGSARLRIDSSGNVGIGTTSPASRLDVSAPNYVDPVLTISQSPITTGNKGVINFTDSAGTTGAIYSYGSAFGAGNNYALTFLTNTGSSLTEKMRITSAGNVGIGTTSPTSALDVVGAIRSSGDGSLIGWYTASGGIRQTSAGGFYIDVNTGGSANLFQIRNGSGFAAQFSITGAGNVGIGVTPSAWSGLRGLQNGNASLSAAAFDGYLSANVFFDGSGWKYINSAFGIQYFQDATTDGAHVWRTAASGSAGAAATLTERMRITSAGVLCVGATSNTSRGGANATALFYKASGTQYVDIQTGGSGISGLLFSAGASGNYGYVQYNTSEDSLVFGAASAERMRITSAGNVHTPAGSTNMTNGFFYMPAAAGAPSGTPTSISGTVPFYYDTTNNQFYVYNGAWKKVTLA